MPQGIAVEVADGFATIDFVDPSLKGPGLAELLEIGGPESISKDTRTGPRHLYVVPEGDARAAGLLDDAALVAPADGIEKRGTEIREGETGELVTTDTGGPYTQLPPIENPEGTVQLAPLSDAILTPGQQGSPVDHAPGEPAAVRTYPDGEPSKDWNRNQLNAYASEKFGIDTTELPDKAAVVNLLAAPSSPRAKVD